MNEQIQIKDRFFDLIASNPSRDGFFNLLKESCGELDNLDFKKTWIDNGKLAKTMLAMANSGGGLIVFGVAEDKKKKIFEPIGLEDPRDTSLVEQGIATFIPRKLEYDVLDFIYDSEIYGEYAGKKYQIMIVRDIPERVPFFSLNKTTDIEKDTIYVRRGTSSVRATEHDIEQIIKRRLENSYKEKSDLSLKDHLEQLHLLYDCIPKTKRVLVKKGKRFSGMLEELKTFQTHIVEVLGEPDQYEEVDNEDYPLESYEQFLSKMIDRKKTKIERVLDLK